VQRSRSTIEQKSLTNKKTEDIYQRISTKFDKISAGLDEQSRLLKQIEVQMEENNKRRGAIDLTPWVVSIPVSFLLVALYNYVQSRLIREQENWEVQFNLCELSVSFGSGVM